MIPVALSPGASFTLAISNVSVTGLRGAFKVIAGTGLGIIVHGALVGLGISSLLVENMALLSVLKIAGIAFLFYLGIRLLVSGLKAHVGTFESLKEVGVKEAFLLNIFNVKALLFYLTIVPIFAGIDVTNYLYLSSLHILTMAVWTIICSFLFIVAQERFSFSKSSMVVNVVGGLCLVYLSCASAFGLNN